MKKTGASLMLTGSIIWLITVMYVLIKALSSGGGGDDMPSEAVLLLIAMIIIPICFLMASIFFLVDNEK